MKKLGAKVLPKLIFLALVAPVYATETIDTSKMQTFSDELIKVAAYGFGLVGGGLAFFGGGQMAYGWISKDPSASADSWKKIVAGGILLVLAGAASFFQATNLGLTTTS